PDLAGEGRVVLVELPFDVLEDALLVLGKGHLLTSSGPRRTPESGGHHRTPPRGQQRAERCIRHAHTRSRGSDAGGSPGPHCCSPERLARSDPPSASAAGRSASSPKRARTASMASVTADHAA